MRSWMISVACVALIVLAGGCSRKAPSREASLEPSASPSTAASTIATELGAAEVEHDDKAGPQGDASVETIGPPALTPTTMPRAKDATLTAAMVAFVQSLRARDVEKIVALLPQTRPLKIASTVVGTTSISFEKAAAGMRARNPDEGLYSVLVDAPDPTFIQYVLDGVEWTWAGGTRFVPDGYARNSPVYVTWRKENGRWVLDTIGFPLA